MEPTKFYLRQTSESLTALGGLPLIGQSVARFSQLQSLIDPRFPVHNGIPNSDILLAQLGLLCQGKNDFEVIKRYRRDRFSARSLGLRAVPSSPTLRQRLGEKAEAFLPRAVVLTPSPILVRMDAGFHGKAIAQTLDRHSQERQAAGGSPLAFLIKWNRRGQDLEARIQQRLADPAAEWLVLSSSREPSHHLGRRGDVGQGSCAPGLAPHRAQHLGQWPTPAVASRNPLEGWDTTLPTEVDPQAVIALYADPATHEQFHAEIKTDLDLERLPSGKFATNDLILTLGAMAYNLLRMIGQNTLLGPDAPPRHPAKRRRVKTVIQEVIIQAARVVHHARQWILSFPENTPGFFAFERLYAGWSAP